jgi:hypothetical protein
MEIHIAVWYVGVKVSEEHTNSNFRVVEESRSLPLMRLICVPLNEKKLQAIAKATIILQTFQLLIRPT